MYNQDPIHVLRFQLIGLLIIISLLGIIVWITWRTRDIKWAFLLTASLIGFSAIHVILKLIK